MTAVFIVSILFLVLYIALLMYYRNAWNRAPDFTPTEQTDQLTTFISVIIPSRNEAQNLPALLSSLKNQHYPAHLFEVLIMDDHSTDDTASILKNFPAGNIRLLSLEQYLLGAEINSYKKKAIEIGIQNSQGQLIVCTDADCHMTAGWLSSIASFYEQYKPRFIAAPVSIDCNLSFLEIFQALDFMTLQGITGAAVSKKIHSMCNGANLAYEKSVFYEVGGFSGIDHIASGDDMLLMHKIFKQHPDKVMFLKSPEAIVQTAAAKSVGAFFNQRIRWASKSGSYDDKSIMAVLLLVYILNLLLLLLPLISLFTKNAEVTMQRWLFLMIIKTVAELYFLYPVARFFKKEKLLFLFPVMQPFHILYTVTAGLLGKFGTYRWKERKVK